MLAHPWRAAALLALYTTGMLLGAALGWKWQALLFLMCLPLFVRALHLSLLLFNRVPNQLARYQPWFEQAVFILWLACFAMGSPDVIAISLGLLIVCPFVSYWVLHAGLDRAPLKVLRMPQAMDKIAYAIQPTLTTLPLILLPFALMGLWSWGIWALAAQCLASWGLFAARLYVWLGTHQSQQR
jgi:hypothetical protein